MSSFNPRLWRQITLSLIVGGLIGCSSLAKLGVAFPFGTPTTPINQLSQQQKGSTLYVTGTVKENAPFLGGGAYQLQDSSGTVWVRTTGNLPNKGDQITIKGQIDYQSIPVANQEVGEYYIVQIEQLRQNPVSNPEPVEPTQPPIKPTPKPVENLLLPHKQQQK